MSMFSQFLAPFHNFQRIKKSFPIITTYNPREKAAAKNHFETFFIQMAFPCFLRPQNDNTNIKKYIFSSNYYVAKSYRFKTLISQYNTSAYQIWLSVQPPNEGKVFLNSFVVGTNIRGLFPSILVFRFAQRLDFDSRQINFASNYTFNKEFSNKLYTRLSATPRLREA